MAFSHEMIHIFYVVFIHRCLFRSGKRNNTNLTFQKLSNTSEYGQEEESDGGAGGDRSRSGDSPVWVNLQMHLSYFFIYLLINLPTYLLTYLLTYLPTYLLISLLTYLLTYFIT